MRICRFDANRLGVVDAHGGIVTDVTAAAAALPPLAWPAPHGDHAIRHLATLREAIDGARPRAERIAIDRVRLLSPVANPSKVIAAPLNYAKHTDEVGAQVEIHANTHPTTFEGHRTPIDKLGLFLKSSTSVAGPGEGVRLAHPDRRTDHEVELAVVIGAEAREVPEAHALDIVAGYCIGLDMTVRGTEDRSLRKSPDSYTVLGPWLVTAEEIDDPGALALSISVGDELRQRSTTASLTVGLSELIALASRWYTLHPGDVVLTGTPDGVAPVAPGDVMTARVDGIGEMQVRVAA